MASIAASTIIITENGLIFNNARNNKFIALKVQEKNTNVE